MINAWGITDRGVVRKENQDGYYLARFGESVVVGVVCDGMGGARAGNVASQLAIETFGSHMEVLHGGITKAPAALLEQAALAANEGIYHRAMTDADCLGMGTTMVAALVQGTTAYLLNIGDSRAYHIGGQGIKKLTRDHSVVEDLVARGKITPEQARSHPQKNLITRALGSTAKVRADLHEKELMSGEYLLLCSDGLSNLVTDQEMLYEVLHGGTAETCCQRLLDITLARGAQDNVTIVLLEMK